MNRLLASSALAILLLASTLPLPAEAKATGPGTPFSDSPTRSNFPAGCSRSFADGCYHMRGELNALDSPKVDVLLVIPASPYAEHDLRAMHQVVDMYEAGIDYVAHKEGWDWLADGTEFHVTPMVCDPVNGDCGEFSTYPVVDPEIVIFRGNPFFVPVGLGAILGIGIDPLAPNDVPCAPMAIANPFDVQEWEALPGFHSHHDGRGGVYKEDCPGIGGNVCFAINGGLSPLPDDDLFGFNVYDIVAHEFGHCLRLGHVGDPGTEFAATASPYSDIMSYQGMSYRKCVSSLDVEQFAVAMSRYLDVNGDGAVTAADRFYNNDHLGDGDPFQVQLPADHYYASSTGKAKDCPQPDLGLAPLGEPVDFMPEGGDDPAGTPVIAITAPEDGATGVANPVTVAGTVDREGAGFGVDAGGPYSGVVGTAIPIAASIAGAAGTPSCSWSGAGATFADASQCATTVTYPTTDGSPFAISVSATDGAASDTDATTVFVTATTGPGTLLGTDATGDAVGGCDSTNPVTPAPCISNPNASHDIAAVSAADDAERLYVYVTMDDLGAFDANQPFHVNAQFAHTAATGDTGLFYSINAGVTSATEATANSLFASAYVLGGGGGPAVPTADVQARIIGDSVELSVDLASIGNPIPGQELTYVQASITTPDTQDYFTVDDTDAWSYTMGSGSPSPSAAVRPLAQVASEPLATESCSGSLPTPTVLLESPACILDVPAGTDHVELYYNTTFTGAFSAVVELFDPSGASRAYSIDDCPAPPSGVNVAYACTLLSEGTVQAGEWKAEIYWQLGEATEDYELTLMARAPDSPPVEVDANGPYVGLVGTAIPVSATATGGSGALGCSWSGAGATFADASQCATTVTYGSPGTKSVSVTASDGAGGSASDTATVTVSDGSTPIERVELYEGGDLLGTAAVSTSSGSPAAGWSVEVRELAAGEHTLTAKWFEDGVASDGGALDSTTVTFTVADSDPCAGVTQGPALSDIAWSADGGSATITWSTDIASDSRVDFGLTPSYGASGVATGSTRSHSVTLTGLSPATTYHYQVSSATCGYSASSVDNTFTTTGRAASVEVTSPARGEVTQAPIAFAGTFDAGDEGSTNSGVGFATAAAGSAPWANTVQGILASPEWHQLVSKLAARKGFQGAVPDLEGGATAFYGGKLPKLPATIAGFEVHAVKAKPRTMAAAVNPNQVAFLDRYSVEDAVADWQSKAAEPAGPAVPELYEGIGPGTAMLMGVDGVQQLCTLSYLFQDPSDPSQYYAATAGHCLLAAAQGVDRTGEANPDQVMNHFELCYSGCLDNALAIGSYVVVGRSAGFEPVAYASAAPVGAADAEGIGRDFGLLRLPKALNPMLRPWLPQFGGPDGEASALLGDLVVHYGHGTYCCPGVGGVASRTPADQGRVAVALGSYADGSYEAVGWLTGGDSGSASGIGWIDSEKGVRGTDALGVNTHGIITGVGYFDGTLLSKGQAMVNGKLGFTPRLVLSADEIQMGGGSDPVASIAFTAPADGATLTAPGPVLVSGTATFPDAAGAGTQAPVTYYLHRPGCGDAADVKAMDLVPAEAEEAGNGCGNLAGTRMAEEWPATQDPGTDIPAGSAVVAHVRAFGLRPHPGVVMAGTLRANGATVGSGSSEPTDVVSLAAVTTPCTEFTIAFTTTQAMHAADDLVFAASTDQGTQDMPICYEGGAEASRVAITPRALPVNKVQLSVDDATFSSGQLPVTGTGSWSASWDLSTVAPGEHTLHARLLQDGVPVGPVASRAVTVEAGAEGGLRTQLRVTSLSGVGFDWTTVGTHDGQQAGSWSFDWTPADAPSGYYNVSARLMQDDEVLAMSNSYFVVDQAPTLDAPSSVAATEAQALELTLAASDPDGDQLWYYASGLPDGAWLDGNVLRWTPDYAQAGSYDLRFTVSDGQLKDSATVRVEVANVNLAPRLSGVGNHTVAAGQLLTFTVTGSDPDGDAVTLSASNLPTGAVFDPVTGTFAWTPSHRQAAGAGNQVYAVTFAASDGELSGQATAWITVTKV